MRRRSAKIVIAPPAARRLRRRRCGPVFAHSFTIADIQMMIPTEPIGSIPRPPELIAALDSGTLGAGVAGTALASAILRERA